MLGARVASRIIGMPKLLQTKVLVATWVLALVTRLWGIASRPIWYDEAFAVLFAEKGPRSMLVGTLSPTAAGAADVHPLGYYSLLWAWMRLFGESLPSARALSVIAGLATVVVFSVLALKVLERKTALAASLLLALSPFHIHYSQEIRMYSFLGLWLLLATYCYWRGSRSDGWLWWLGFAVFAALGQYTQSLAAFYLAALALWPLITRNGRALKRTVLAGSLALLLYLPWLVQVPGQLARVGHAYWIDKPGLYRIFTLPLAFVTGLPLPNPWLAPALFMALSILAFGFWRTLAAIKVKRPDLQSGLWSLYLAFLPPALLFLFSQWEPLYLERALLPSGVMFALWLAWTVMDTRAPGIARIATVVFLAVAFSMGFYQHVAYDGFPYAPYQSLMHELEARREASDVVIHSNKLSMLPSVYYDRTLPQSYIADPPGSGQDTLAPSTQQVLGLEAKTDIRSAAGGAERVWFVIFDRSIQEYVRAGYSTHPDIGWLMAHYSQIQVDAWGDLRVFLFSKRP